MSSHKKHGIVALGSSKEIIGTRQRFLDYLDNLVDGSWLAEFGEYTCGKLTYLRYTKRVILNCKEARILLLSYDGEMLAELHVNDADVYSVPIVTHYSKHVYRMGYPIRSDADGSLVYRFKNDLRVGDLYGKHGFPGSIQGGSYVSPTALDYIRRTGSIKLLHI